MVVGKGGRRQARAFSLSWRVGKGVKKGRREHFIELGSGQGSRRQGRAFSLSWGVGKGVEGRRELFK